MPLSTEQKERMTKATSAFITDVWPVIRLVLGGGELRTTEQVVTDTEIARALDFAGVDHLQLCEPTGLRPIAARVQPGNYRTFSVRYRLPNGKSTEWQKLNRAIDAGLIYPTILVQAYTTKDAKVADVGIIYTADLVDAIKRGRPGYDYQLKTNSTDGNEFLVIGWDALRKLGVRIWTLKDGLATGRGLLSERRQLQ